MLSNYGNVQDLLKLSLIHLECSVLVFISIHLFEVLELFYEATGCAIFRRRRNVQALGSRSFLKEPSGKSGKIFEGK